MVMDSFLTDTADYADIVLPATTQLEHYDVHKSYGHLYVLANNPAIAPVGEVAAEHRGVPPARRAHGLRRRLLPRQRRGRVRARRSAPATATCAGIDWEALKEHGWQRLAVPERFAPFAEGGFPTPSGKCEFYSEALAKQGIDPLPFYNPPRRAAARATRSSRAGTRSASSRRRARNFLNSSFANLPRFREADKEPELELHPDDAARARHRATATAVRVFNDRGAFRAVARVNGKPRRGVVVAPSVWWKKFSPDGRNANDVTSQRTADLGGAATFYDCLVEVEKA